MSFLKDISLIKDIVEKSLEKLKSAEDLYSLKHYDDAISRAYYSVFHMMTAVVFSKGNTFSSHKETISFFNKEYLNTSLITDILFKDIKDLFDKRQAGDYDIKTGFDENTAKDCIIKAKNIFNNCIRYLSDIYQEKFEYLI